MWKTLQQRIELKPPILIPSEVSTSIGFPPPPTLACPSESRNGPYRVFCFFFGGSGRCGGDSGGGFGGGSDAEAEGGFSSRWTNFDPGPNEFVSAMTRLALKIKAMKVLFTSIVLNGA